MADEAVGAAQRDALEREAGVDPAGGVLVDSPPVAPLGEDGDDPIDAPEPPAGEEVAGLGEESQVRPAGMRAWARLSC